MLISVEILTSWTRLIVIWHNHGLDSSSFMLAVLSFGNPSSKQNFALSTTESEIISLSTALKVVIPLMEIAQEMKDKGYNILSTQPLVWCHAFEDNSGALE